MPDNRALVEGLIFAVEAVVPSCEDNSSKPRILGYKLCQMEDGTFDLLIILNITPTEEGAQNRVKEFIEIWLGGNRNKLPFNELINKIIVISTQDLRTGIYNRI